MKLYLNYFQKILILLLMTFFFERMSAVDFEVNGITYNTSALTNTTVKVTGKTNGYTGAIVIPESITYQGNNYTVTSIDEDAFYQNNDIISIELPKTIIYIDESAFEACVNLDKVYISNLESWLKIGFENSSSNPLKYASHLYVEGKEVCDVIIPDGITEVDEFAFCGYKGIRSLIIPASIKNIWRAAFSSCINLKMVKVKGTNPIQMDNEYDSPFSSISPSAKLVVPKGTIRTYVATPKWRECFGEIVEEDNEENEIISFVDPNVESICKANWDSNGDGKLSKEEVAAVTDTSFGKKFRKSSIEIFPEFKYFTGLTYIGNEAFEKCSKLSFINLPPNIKTIGGQAFKECGFTFLSISEGVETIGYQAFSGCPLNTIVIPESVNSISSDYPFPRFLTKISISQGNAYYECPYNSLCIVRKDSKTVIFGTNNSKIPYGVLHIGANSFHGATELTNISIPNSVLTIDKDAFYNCNKLESVDFSVGLTTIGESAFNNCSNLVSAKLPVGLTTIGESAFGNCTSLSEMQFPNTLKSIGSVAFEGCSKLETIMIPQSVSDWQGSAFLGCDNLASANVKCIIPIPYQAFADCKKLESVVLAEGINTINNNAFSGCTSLVSINLPSTIKSIGSATFIHCSSLEKIVIPENITSIGSSAFANCTSLAYVESKVKQPFELNGVFSSLPYNSELHVPYGTKVLYESTQGWNVFGEIIEAAPQQFDLNIASVGNGSAKCNGNTIRNQSLSIKVTEGSPTTISLYPDTGYRVASIKVNGQDALSQVNDHQLVIPVTDNTNVAIVFEAITHTLTIKATGNGSVVYNETMIRDNSSSFIVNDGTSAIVKFVSDAGYKIKSVKLNAVDITSSVKNNQYTISNVNSDNSLEVEFEAITHTLTIKATGNGSVEFYEMTIRDNSSSFTVNDGTSAVVKFVSDAGYKIKSVKLNSTDITSSLNESQYTICNIKSDCTLEVEFEAITHTLSVVATGNGNVDYNGIVIRNQSQSYFVQEGSSIIFSFIPDAGFRVGNVKVNNTDVTASVENNSYTISNITANVTLTVTFEAIPPTTYSFTISAVGNGTVTYDGNTLRGETSSFTVVEGTNIVVKLAADEGSRLKSVKLDNVDVTSSVVNNQYTISNIKSNTSLEVAFEVIPTYVLTVKATGNGLASYEGKVVRDQSNAFMIAEGTDATVTFIPDNGYKIKSVKVDEVDVTAIVVNDQFTISKVSKDTSLEVEFEAKNYTLAITSKGNGTVNYDGNTVRSKTSTFTLAAGTSVLVEFASDEGYRIMSVKLDGADITSNVFNNQYTIVNITHDVALEVEFSEDVTDITHNGVNYKVASYLDATLNVAAGDYGLSLSVPATLSFKNRLWKVVGVEANALNNCSELASIEWNPEAKFNGRVSNPNLLLYVKDKQYGSETIQNVVVNGEAEEIVLQETNGGNNFYCPKAFIAKKVTYNHNYSMKSGYNTCQGWETIALPFDVTKIQRQGGTELLPYQAWTQGSNQRPFWLYSLTELGWKAESSITANTPYIISMPNNEMYNPSYNISGIVQFIGENVQVKVSDNLAYGKDGNKKLIPIFQNQEASQDFFVLNVNNQWSSNTDAAVEGSVFICGLRKIHPFEAYMTIDGNAASRVIPVFGDQELTGIYDIPFTNKDNRDVKVYTLEGQLVATGKRAELMKKLSKGIFVIDGQKVVVIGK